MEIKTKFDIGDELYFIKDYSIKFDEVIGISFNVADKPFKSGDSSRITREEYCLSHFDRVAAEDLYRSKEELIKKLR